MYDRRSPALGAGPVLTRELLDSERKFVGAMQQFSFGRIEGLGVRQEVRGGTANSLIPQQNGSIQVAGD
jgi:hypothetical protein